MERIQYIKKNTKMPPETSAKDAFKHIMLFFQQKKGRNLPFLLPGRPIQDPSNLVVATCWSQPGDESMMVDDLVPRFPLHKFGT